jgi:hypothetical protein
MLAPRRSPLRPVVLVLVVLTLLVVALLALGSSHTSPKEARVAAVAYVDDVRPLLERSTTTGQDLKALRDSAPKLGRDALDRQLVRAEQDATAVATDAKGVNVPKDATLAQDLLLGVLGARASAVKALHVGFGKALDPNVPALQAVQALTDVGQDLQAADGAYRLFVRNVPPGGGDVPDSRWVDDPSAWTTPVLGSLVTTLRNSTSLAPVHDVGVILAAPQPGPVGKEASAEVLAAVQSIQLQVVVANQGNTPERQLVLSATTQPFDGSTPSQVKQTIDLDAGQRRALDLEGLVPPNVGVPFAITVRIGPVQGDTNPVDDELTRQYVLR